MKWLTSLFVCSLILGCKGELEFNPNIHIATADAINFEVSEFTASSQVGNGYRGLRLDPVSIEHSNFIIEYEVGNNVDALYISIRLPYPTTVSCEDIPFIDRNTWRNAETFTPTSTAVGIKWGHLISELWVIDEEMGESFACIESISKTGEEVFGTFDLHFKKAPDFVLPDSRWPDSFSLINGKFRAFVVSN